MRTSDTYEMPLVIPVVGLAFLMIAAYGVVDRIDRNADEADPMPSHAALAVAAAAQKIFTARELAKGYQSCPPREPGMTDIVTLVIRSTADDKPEVLTCIRYAERPYAPRSKRQGRKTTMAEQAKQ